MISFVWKMLVIFNDFGFIRQPTLAGKVFLKRVMAGLPPTGYARWPDEDTSGCRLDVCQPSDSDKLGGPIGPGPHFGPAPGPGPRFFLVAVWRFGGSWPLLWRHVAMSSDFR